MMDLRIFACCSALAVISSCGGQAIPDAPPANTSDRSTSRIWEAEDYTLAPPEDVVVATPAPHLRSVTVVEIAEADAGFQYIPELIGVERTGSIRFSLEGDDAGFFLRDFRTGAISLRDPLLAENPLDANGDNRYEVVLVVETADDASEARFPLIFQPVPVAEVDDINIDVLFPPPNSNAYFNSHDEITVAIRVTADDGEPAQVMAAEADGISLRRSWADPSGWFGRVDARAAHSEIQLSARSWSGAAKTAVATVNNQPAAKRLEPVNHLNFELNDLSADAGEIYLLATTGRVLRWRPLLNEPTEEIVPAYADCHTRTSQFDETKCVAGLSLIPSAGEIVFAESYNSYQDQLYRSETSVYAFDLEQRCQRFIGWFGYDSHAEFSESDPKYKIFTRNEAVLATYHNRLSKGITSLYSEAQLLAASESSSNDLAEISDDFANVAKFEAPFIDVDLTATSNYVISTRSLALLDSASRVVNVLSEFAPYYSISDSNGEPIRIPVDTFHRIAVDEGNHIAYVIAYGHPSAPVRAFSLLTGDQVALPITLSDILMPDAPLSAPPPKCAN